VTAVLKVDMHCDGCAKRIRGSVRRYPGKQRNAMKAPCPLPVYLSLSLAARHLVMSSRHRQTGGSGDAN
jgi:copper chaperone CopZ